MKKLATLCVCLLSAAHLLAQINELKRVSPEEMGISTADVTAMLDTLIGDRATSIHSIIVMRKGAVVAEAYPKPFDMEYSHTLYSASKTFVSAAVGIAIAENRLRLTDRVATFFPEFLPDTIGDNLAQMTVRNLLTMSSGIEPDWVMRTITTEWIPTWLRKTINLPGKDFKYDSIDTYLLSAIVSKVTGKTLLEYLNEKVFGPLHVTTAAWQISPEGFNTGGWGLYVQPETMAKFGQLLLDKGRWNGHQLKPERWTGLWLPDVDGKTPGFGQCRRRLWAVYHHHAR